VGAAAEVYFGKSVHELTLAEIALIAGLPRALARQPRNQSAARRHNAVPTCSADERDRPDRSPKPCEAAAAAPITPGCTAPQVELRAPWIAEMARRELLDRFGPDAYTAGYAVVTTVDSRLQPLSQEAVRAGLERYDRRHGYRGPVAVLDDLPDDELEAMAALVDGYPEPGPARGSGPDGER
jgi:penicillin-binding protein 1A